MCASFLELEGEVGLETVVLPIESLTLCNQPMIASYSKIKKGSNWHSVNQSYRGNPTLLLETAKAKTVSITEYL